MGDDGSRSLTNVSVVYSSSDCASDCVEAPLSDRAGWGQGVKGTNESMVKYGKVCAMGF